MGPICLFISYKGPHQQTLVPRASDRSRDPQRYLDELFGAEGYTV